MGRPAKPKEPTEPVVTLAEAARRLGISRQAVAHLVQRGELVPVTVLVRAQRLPLAAVLAYQPSAVHQARGRGIGRAATGGQKKDTVVEPLGPPTFSA